MIIPIYSLLQAKSSVNQNEQCCDNVMTISRVANHTFQFNLISVAKSRPKINLKTINLK